MQYRFICNIQPTPRTVQNITSGKGCPLPKWRIRMSFRTETVTLGSLCSNDSYFVHRYCLFLCRACLSDLHSCFMSFVSCGVCQSDPDSKFHGANMRPIWGRQDPGGPRSGHMNFAIWGHSFLCNVIYLLALQVPEGINKLSLQLPLAHWESSQHCSPVPRGGRQ